MSSFVDTWNSVTSNKKPLNIEQKVTQTLLFATRRLYCPWDSCPQAEEAFANIKALFQTKTFLAVTATSTRKLWKKPGIPCKYSPNCKFVAQTSDELMNHVQRIHMIVLQTTCHLCAFRDASFLMMLQHFERKHFITADKLPLPPISTPVSKKIDWIWDTPSSSSPLPPLPPPSSRGRIYTYNFLVGRIQGDPTFDPKQMEEIATLERKEGTFTFLDDEAKTEEPLTIISSTRSPSRQQRRDGGGEGGGGNILIGTSHYHILNNTTNNTSSGGNNNNHGQQQQQSTTTTGTTKAAAFYSVLREEPPTDRPKLSNPTMYRLGTPVVSRRPPPTITNFFGMKAIVLPTLQKQHQQQQQQQQQQN